MGAVYILSRRGQLSKSDMHLVYKDYEGNCTRILPDCTERIVVLGAASVTAEALILLARNKISVSFNSFGGADSAAFQYGDGRNVFLRQAQYRLADDEKRSLAVAKDIAAGKIRNQLAFMQRIKRTDGLESPAVSAVSDMKAVLAQAEACNDMEALRGFEGIASRHYFSVLGSHIKPPWAVFDKRSKRPPKTNVNAVLSFLYTLLAQQLSFLLQAKGFDVMVGTLHELAYGRHALTFDLMEEFRTPAADTLCCRLFNNGMLKEDDFEPAEGGIYLTKAGTKKAVAAFEEKMAGTITYEGKEVSFRELMLDQAELYRQAVLKQAERYVPFRYR